jgi:hypothetical protein
MDGCAIHKPIGRPFSCPACWTVYVQEGLEERKRLMGLMRALALTPGPSKN